MAKTDFKSKIKINTYDDLFGGPVSLNEVKYLSLNDLHDFKDHPFQVKDDEDMNKLVESIKEQGVLDPAIVRQRKEGVSGRDAGRCIQDIQKLQICYSFRRSES